MKNRTLLVVGTLTISLLAGCSKRPLHSAWTSSDSMVVEPNVSVGPVHSGMTMQQVVTQLGEPDQKSDGKMLYGNLGFEVDFGPGGKVEQVVCSAGDNSGITKSFGGQTKEGIGIGATRAEVVRAYGNPAPIKSDQEQGAETMLYVSPGVAFQLSHDKVSMMYVRLMK